MKWLFRSFVFVAAFLFGVIAYAFTVPNGLSNCTFDVSPDRALIGDSMITAPRPRGISVLYAGLDYDRSDSPPRLRFVILNGSDLPVTYSAHFPTGAFPILTANGRELPQTLLCGTGTKTYYIGPGSSAEVNISASQFHERPRKSDDVTVGFRLISPYYGSTYLYTSEKFRLPEEFRNAIHTFRD